MIANTVYIRLILELVQNEDAIVNVSFYNNFSNSYK